MTYTPYGLIQASEYNNIQSKISAIIGTGSASRGYGQTTYSSPVAEGTKITELQWDYLRYDIVNAIVHQTGSLPVIVDIDDGEILSYSSSYETQYSNLATQADTNRFVVASGQYATETGTSSTQSVAFKNYAQAVFTITFSSANQARYFFNSGGALYFGSSFTPSATYPTTQERTWRDTLNAAGTLNVFNGFSGSVNFYTLTNSDQNFVTERNSSPYSNNYWYVKARCNVANNSSGTATSITFTSLWQDSYTDPGPPAPGDGVIGTMSLTVAQRRATGSLYPALASGTFSITPPSYGAVTWTQSGTPT